MKERVRERERRRERVRERQRHRDKNRKGIATRYPTTRINVTCFMLASVIDSG